MGATTNVSRAAAVMTVGYPRIGPKREMKKALEDFWSAKIDAEQLRTAFFEVLRTAVRDQVKAGVHLIGVGDHTMYDQVLDWSVRFGLVPSRFADLKTAAKEGSAKQRLDLYFALARGRDDRPALDMTKWFNTNYHNLTPEIEGDLPASASPADCSDWRDFLELLEEAKKEASAEKISAIVLGPLTLFHCCKLPAGLTFEKFRAQLLPYYQRLFKDIWNSGIREVQLHEPALVMEKYHTQDIRTAYTELTSALSGSGASENPALHIVTYFDDLGEAFEWATRLPGVAGISLDFTRGENLKFIKDAGFPADRRLGAGVFDGRSVWADEEFASSVLSCLVKLLPHLQEQYPQGVQGQPPILIQPSCPLQHVPVDLELEDVSQLPSGVASRLRFARQKLADMRKVCESLPKLVEGAKSSPLQDPLPVSPDGGYMVGVADDPEPTDAMVTRVSPYEKRRDLQLRELSGMYLPTSTIGSFPQTVEMRKIRLQFKKGEVNKETYLKAVDHYINYCIGVQEGIGLDVLVHGEPERSDMVEYFAEHMDGFLVTSNGWVQSYGSRYVRPPIVYGTVKREGGKAITTREFSVAQNLTKKAVKGMLTGPVTILNWSFPRKDASRKTQAFQIGQALRDEVADLDVAGCRCLQMDEPALREGLPLRASRRAEYLRWAVRAFKLATTVAKPTTHVVTHLCYSEFGEIMESIKAMDTDQVTIENSRSDGAMLPELEECDFSHNLAPGVYDVHSPVVPSEEALAKRLLTFGRSQLKKEQFWVVPDCGLKTRRWDEVIPSLRNMVQATKRVRRQWAEGTA